MSEPERDQMKAELILRPRRQVTLPAWVCESLGLEVGDHLEVSVTEGALVARPRKALALKALREIQQAFSAAGVTEEELQEEGRKTRVELSRARYGGE